MPTDFRILMVDPALVVSEAVTLAVHRYAQVVRATTGLEGLVIAAERQVDLVIADAHLPDVPSEGFLRVLRLLRPGVPVAFLGSDRPLEERPRSEADAYFPEPIQLAPLLRWIADRLDRPTPDGPEAGPGVASPPVRYEAPDHHLEIVRRALGFIDRCCQDGTRFSEVAKAAGVSRWHLCRIFKRVTGLPFKRFLTRRRLQAAKELLRDPRMPIHQVASLVGYQDPGHFNRVFRQWEGQAPSRYRRQVTRSASIAGRLPADGPAHPILR